MLTHQTIANQTTYERLMAYRTNITPPGENPNPNDIVAKYLNGSINRESDE